MTLKGGSTRKEKIIPLTQSSKGIPLGHNTLTLRSKTGKINLFAKNKKGTRRYTRR
jgi:hypothetical protein